MDQQQKELEIAQQIQRSLTMCASNVKINDTKVSATGVALILTIAEQMDATILLIQNGFSTHAPLLVRSMLERVVDLVLLTNDPAYYEQMEFESLIGDKRRFDGMAAAEDMKDDPSVQEQLAQWTEILQPRLDALAEKGYKEKTLVVKFSDVDKLGIADSRLKDGYTAFRVFSAFAHSTLSVLKVRHSDIDSERAMRPAPPELVSSILKSALIIFVDAIRQLPKLTDASEAAVTASIALADASWSKLHPA